MMHCGLLGRTLGHSLSPEIHAYLGEYRYTLEEVEPDQLAHFLRTTTMEAMNVTIPYKEAVIPYCEALTPLAQKLGAVNTLTRTPRGGWLGDNTDYWGLFYALKEAEMDWRGAKVAILGSGGSSKMVAGLARDMGAQDVWVISRQGVYNYEHLGEAQAATVLVNTTPVGMSPLLSACPIDIERFPLLESVVDIIYNPSRTPLIQAAQTKGLKTMNGLSMLVIQALEASDRFLGCARPLRIATRITQELMTQRQNLVLIGMPGVGKSTLGRQLAQRLDRPFVDLDTEFEAIYQLSPRQYIERYGEPAFRDAESETLKTVASRHGIVLACGGGTPLREENQRLLKANGWVFYLERELSSLSTQGRPLSQKHGLEKLYEVRDPIYRRVADECVLASDINQALMTMLGARV